LIRALMLVSLAVALTAIGNRAAMAQMPPVTINPAQAAALISSIRAQNGLGPVAIDPDLMARAQVQANAMAAANVVDHSIAGTFQQRIRDRLNGPVAENVAAGLTSLEALLSYWMTSPQHYQNMLLRGGTNIGIAAAYNPASPYGNFFALIITGPPGR
jgi:uncharacterized protein YkwD